MTNSELLIQLAQQYKKFTQYEYSLEIAKKGCKRIINIKFTTGEFKHLFGLHKAKEFPDIYNASSGALLRRVLNGTFPHEKLQTCVEFPNILSRWQYLCNLERYMDEFQQLYDFDPKLASNAGIITKIKGDHMIAVEDNSVFIFFIQDKSGSVKISNILPKVEVVKDVNLKAETFIVGNLDYTRGQNRPHVVLYKIKRHNKTNTTEVKIDKNKVLSKL